MTKVTYYMYSCNICCMSREVMEIDGLDSAKCQKSKRRDMMRIVNDNKTKLVNRFLPQFEAQKRAVDGEWGSGWAI